MQKVLVSFFVDCVSFVLAGICAGVAFHLGAGNGALLGAAGILVRFGMARP